MPSLEAHGHADAAHAAATRAMWHDIDAREHAVPQEPDLVHPLETTPLPLRAEQDQGAAAPDRPPLKDQHGEAIPTDPEHRHPLELQSRFQNLLHAHTQKQRTAIIDALYDSAAASPLQKRAQHLGSCCCRPSIRSSSTGPRPSLARCRDRLCPLCASSRPASVITNGSPRQHVQRPKVRHPHPRPPRRPAPRPGR